MNSTASRSVVISFIRNIKDNTKDDSLTINPTTSQSVFDISYRDYLNGVRNHSIASEHEVYDFIDNVFNLLPLDRDPFTHFQIIAPTFPTVLLEIPTMYNPVVRESIMSVVKNTLRNWPDVTNTQVRRPVTRSQTTTA